MAEDIKGMFRSIERVSLVEVLTSPWHDIAGTGFKQNIVEGEPFANLHRSLPFCGLGIPIRLWRNKSCFGTPNHAT